MGAVGMEARPRTRARWGPPKPAGFTIVEGPPGHPAHQGRVRRQRARAGSGDSSGLSHSDLLHSLPEAALAGVIPANLRSGRGNEAPAGSQGTKPQLSPIVQHPPAALEQALQRLEHNIRTARLRRRWQLEDVAERMGVSRFTVADLERGKPGTSIAAYLGALWVLGLLDQLAEVADPDRDGEGKALEAARQPGQAPRRHRFDDDF